jgi:hypothetical protein
LLLLVVLAAVAFAAWRFSHPEPSTPPVQVSQTDEQSGRDKAAALAGAVAQADRTGRPQPVNETFTDAELTSLANDQVAERNLPLDQVVLHATAQGTIDGHAEAYAGGRQVPVTFRLVPVVEGDTLSLNVQQLNLASVPLPGPITSQITDQVRQMVDVKQPLNGIHDLHIVTSEGKVTVTGVATPT